MRQITVIFSLVFFLSGCTSLVNSVVKEPINPDPTSSTFGSDINDLKMDTFIGVNIKKIKKIHNIDGSPYMCVFLSLSVLKKYTI